jgi:hypothetical protein
LRIGSPCARRSARRRLRGWCSDVSRVRRYRDGCTGPARAYRGDLRGARRALLGSFPQINDWLIYDSDWVPVTAGRPYTSTYHLRAEGSRDTDFWSEQLYFDQAGNQVGQYWSPPLPVSTSWQRSAPLTVSAPPGAVWALVRLTVPYAYDTRMHYDAVQFEESQHATSYRDGTAAGPNEGGAT